MSSEYFIVANSFAAPFCSDTSEHYIEATSPVDALNALERNYKHPAGLYAAAVYSSHKAYTQGEKPLARYESNQLHAINEATRGLSTYSIRTTSSNTFEADGVEHQVQNPKQGQVYAP